MEKWIQNIKGAIPHTNTTVDIELNGKNLIVTGPNGSGKTSFLRMLYDANFITLSDEKKVILKFFEEKRLAEIKQPQIGQKIDLETDTLGNQLEQHLLNLKTRQSYAISLENNKELADDIQKWFDDFESKLKILFEDDTIKLSFKYDKVDETGFEIIQKDKPPFSFQTLSAGYRAIFDIYADLLMHTEYFKIMPCELTGVVFIDEIDSHLHISLQRLILPFFTQSFPKIQFIATTHSPFVLMSTPDTVIFDLTKNEPITEDLSYYTYSAVMEGLWDVKPIAAWVEQKIKEIATIINSDSKDIQRLKRLLEEIKGREDGLDSESKTIYLLGKQALLKEEQADV